MEAHKAKQGTPFPRDDPRHQQRERAGETPVLALNGESGSWDSRTPPYPPTDRPVQVPGFSPMSPSEPEAQCRKTAKHAYSRLGIGMLIFMLGQLVFPALLSFLINALFPGATQNAILRFMITYGSMYLLGLPLMRLFLKGLPDAPPPMLQGERMRLQTVLTLFPVLYAVTIAVNLLGSQLERLLGKEVTVTTGELLETGMPIWLLGVMSLLIAPVMEELVFRRMTYQKAAGYGAMPYIIWSSIAFGLFHLNFTQTLYAAALGLFLAVVMLRTGSVRYSILLHLMVNATGFLGTLASVNTDLSNPQAELPVLMGVFGLLMMVLLVAGLVLGISLLNRLLRWHRQSPNRRQPVRLRDAVCNPGSILYGAVCMAVMVGLAVMQ